jgi:hypothetical protein
LWIAGFLRKVFISILVGYGLPENRQISQDMYRLKPEGESKGLPTKRSRAGRMKSGSDSSTTFLDLGTGLGQRPIVC